MSTDPTRTTDALAELTSAVAGYETAWRSYVGATGEERRNASEAMSAEQRNSQEARAALNEQVGPDLARQIHAALVFAAATTYGERTTLYRDREARLTSVQRAIRRAWEYVG